MHQDRAPLEDKSHAAYALTTEKRDVGLVHDWLPLVAGAELVLREMVSVCPNSTVYTLFDFLNEAQRDFVAQGRPVVTSRLNRLPGVEKYYRLMLLSCTRAIEEFDLTKHDIVMSSSAALAKGVITSPDQAHIAYVHSPARYAWDLTHEYINGIGGPLAGLKRAYARRVMHQFRMWDLRTVTSVNTFVANSNFIRKRIWKTYRREAEVIYPPVDVRGFQPNFEPRDDYYVTVSRMVPYKRIPMIAQAFALRPNLRLKIVGTGPELAKVRDCLGPNVELMGHLPKAEMCEVLRGAKAFVFGAKEDFGIAPVEAQACGTPVIAFGEGGATETVRNLGSSGPTGLWYDQQTPEALARALDRFEAEGSEIRPEICRANAESFSTETFRLKMSELLGRF